MPEDALKIFVLTRNFGLLKGGVDVLPPGGASQQGVGAEKSVVELNLVEVQAA